MDDDQPTLWPDLLYRDRRGRVVGSVWTGPAGKPGEFRSEWREGEPIWFARGAPIVGNVVEVQPADNRDDD